MSTRIGRFTTAVALVAALALTLGTSARAQSTYKRHALLEEGTGTWCGWCPYGAYTIDSLTRQMGDHLVVISWHGPTSDQEPFGTKQGDTLESYLGVTGFPWASIGRQTAGSGAYTTYPNPWATQSMLMARQAPVVDFRLVNAIYNPGTKTVDFDLDITPYDVTSLPKEDSVTYVTVGVLTEDGMVESQEQYASGNFPNGPIDDFHHYNVARAVGGKVLGDAYTMGTKTSVNYPIRKHYHIATKSGWVLDSLRIKAFTARRSNKNGGSLYLDAAQTGYITSLPSSAPNAAWLVLPRAGDMIPAGSTTLPIVFGRGGNTSNVKLSYSTDKGVTWTSITNAASSSPYQWTIPNELYGMNGVRLLIQDASNAQVSDTSGSFGFSPRGTITIDAPRAGDTLVITHHSTINYQVSGAISEDRSIQYSSDSGKSWNIIAAVNGATTYDWVVPNTPTGSAFVRVVDGNNMIGTSGRFAIVPAGTVNMVTVQGAPTLQPGQASSIGWTGSGYLGSTVDIDISYDNKTTWAPIATAFPITFGSYSWTVPTPPTNGVQAVVRLSFNSGAVGYSNPFTIGNAGVNDAAFAGSAELRPNPATNEATLHFTLPNESAVSLSVYDLLGHEMSHSALGVLGAGDHQQSVDASRLTPGTYTYLLKAGSHSFKGKFTVVR